MSESKSVQAVTMSALCCACGNCVSLCPAGAVSLVYNPAGFLQAQVNEKKCIRCGKCLCACPSWQENTAETLQEYPHNWHEGNVVAGFMGHATDNNIRLRGQSGGLITGLLSWLKESGQIDGAAVANFSEAEQRAVAVLAKTTEEIKAAAGSYYLQVPMMEALAQADDPERVAVVCTGCHSGAIHFGEKNLGKKRPYLVIGLACAGTYGIGMLRDLVVSKSGFRKIKEFRFKDKRNGGWPGGVYIGYENNKSQLLPTSCRTRLKKYYATYRCLQCPDINNLYADIVCGDPWYLHHSHRLSKESTYCGETVVVARTLRGKEILEAAARAGILQLQKINYQEFFEHNSYKAKFLAQSCAVQVICQKHNLPQLFSEVNLRNTLPMAVQEKLVPAKNLEQQVLFTWNYHNATDAGAAAEMVDKVKRHDKVKELIMLPVKFILYVLRRCKRLIQ